MLDRDDYAQDTPLLSEDREIDPDAAFGGKHARKELEARLVSKLDSRMSILILIYILNYIDRNNASAARLHGFERDLNLTGNQFASILSILYVGYLVMQIPSFVSVMYTRFFIGFTEAAFFPGAWFLISKWYTRRELSQRTALLSCGSLISNAFGSLIASGILDTMEGRLGYAAWRYFPTLAETMGYGRTLTLLLCAPPWFFATFAGFAISRHSDQVGERFWHIVTPLLVGILGFLLAMSTMNTIARYISLFLMAQSYAGFITYLSWASGTIRPAHKRAVALAFINMVSSLGNIGGSYIWPSTWGPSYRASYSVCIFASALGILLSFMFRQHLAFLNAEAERREAELDEPKGYRYLL
ncbi:major facilitator superfamily domain-containing protein [Mycena capillaripes]|nr:major facilitator superfamily domain-containing protein [Mycena capillaripes]